MANVAKTRELRMQVLRTLQYLGKLTHKQVGRYFDLDNKKMKSEYALELRRILHDYADHEPLKQVFTIRKEWSHATGEVERESAPEPESSDSSSGGLAAPAPALQINLKQQEEDDDC